LANPDGPIYIREVLSNSTIRYTEAKDIDQSRVKIIAPESI
jgi:hypothetical protein